MPGFTASLCGWNPKGTLWIDYILYFYAWLYSIITQLANSSKLWIDYILYFYAWLYSPKSGKVLNIAVVNWLHFVFLCLALQLGNLLVAVLNGCELITFCIFMPGFTALPRLHRARPALWIDYILYFYAWLYSAQEKKLVEIVVVNWLHFVFLCLALQPCQFSDNLHRGCELITFCIFMPGFTAKARSPFNSCTLWIDYILYFYAWLYSKHYNFQLTNWVVNWLHFVFLCLALQLQNFSSSKTRWLWIDYILYFYAWLYSYIAST